MSEKNTTSSSISTFGLLGIAFVILKLCNIITWSWWWVTLPFWGGVAIVIIAAIIVFIIKILL